MTLTKSARTRKLYASREEIKLEKPIGAGREGTVHPVCGQPHTAVKLIGPANPDPELTGRKLAVMVNHPPTAASSRHYRVTWPTGLVSSAKRGTATAGYTMPLMNPDQYRPIGTYFNPSRRRRLLEGRERGYTYLHLHLVKMALNLSKAVDSIHAHSTVIGDLNSRNVLASDQGRIAVIDTDSFQIHDPNTGETYRCLVGTPEYTPPRLQGIDFGEADRTPEDDLFALAVMLYQLMIQGAHPYSGRGDGNGNQAADDVASRIARRNFAHGNANAKDSGDSGGGATLNNLIVWNSLPLKREFKNAFQSTRPRTTASAWAQTIAKAAMSLKNCTINPLHWHFGKACTWCRYRRQTGIEAFPQPGDGPPGRKLPTRTRKRSTRARTPARKTARV